jgi:hypothetical protein
VADLLLQALDLTLTREARRHDQRRELGPVVEAYARLKSLREPGPALQAPATNSK